MGRMRGIIFWNIHVMPTMCRAPWQANSDVIFSEIMSESKEVEFYKVSLTKGH